MPDTPTPIGRPSPQESWRIDKTFNLSTVIAVVVAVVGVTSFGVRANNDLENRINKVTYDAETIRLDVRRIETMVNAQATTQSGSLSTLRVEIREDLKEVNGKLDRLLVPVGGGTARTNPNQGWTR